MARLSPFFNPNDQDFSSVIAGYTGQVPPVEKGQLETTLGGYKVNGAKITMASAKGKTDRQLYDMAANAVVGKFKDAKAAAEKAAAEAAKRAAEQKAAAERAQREAQARAQREAQARAQQQAQQRAQQQAAQRAAPSAARVSQPSAKLPDTAMPAPLSDAQVRQILAAAGHPNWNPPAYARTSTEALRAWIKRAETYAAQSRATTTAAARTGGTGTTARRPTGPVPIDSRTTTSTTRTTSGGGGRILIR